MLSTRAITSIAALFALLVTKAVAGNVYAHFILGNVGSYTQSDWAKDIATAADSKIDGFGLNIGGDSYTDTQLSYAYAAAEAHNNFKLFISFDYASNPSFAASVVERTINKYKVSSTQHNTQASLWCRLSKIPALSETGRASSRAPGAFLFPIGRQPWALPPPSVWLTVPSPGTSGQPPLLTSPMPTTRHDSHCSTAKSTGWTSFPGSTPTCLFLILHSTTSVSATVPPLKHGPDSRHSVEMSTIPSLLALTNRCHIDGFNISCHDNKPFLAESNTEVLEILFSEGHLPVIQLLAKDCYSSDGIIRKIRNISMELTYLPYQFSNTRNKFVAIGCDTFDVLTVQGTRISSDCSTVNWNAVTGSQIAPSSPSTSTCIVSFVAKDTTIYGENIFIAVDDVVLDSWDTDKALALDADQYTADNPLWEGSVRLSALSRPRNMIFASFCHRSRVSWTL